MTPNGDQVMPISESYYKQLEQSFADAMSDDEQALIDLTTEKQIDVAMSALDLYLGWFGNDVALMNDPPENFFASGYPQINSEEPGDDVNGPDKDKRSDNQLFDVRWVKDDGKWKQQSFYDNAGRMTARGREYVQRLAAIDQRLASTPVTLSEQHPYKEYNDWTPYQLTTEKTVLTKKLNGQCNLPRRAVGIYQTHNKLRAWKWFVKPESNERGIKMSYTLARGSTELARTPKPILLFDTIPQVPEYKQISVSSFLALDIEQAMVFNVRDGVTPLAALLKTLKREQEENKEKPVRSLEDVTNTITTLRDDLTNPEMLRSWMQRMEDKKHGAALYVDTLYLFFDLLKPVLDQPVHQLAYQRLVEANIVKEAEAETKEQRTLAIKKDIAKLSMSKAPEPAAPAKAPTLKKIKVA
jgi:hypothetical protein